MVASVKAVFWVAAPCSLLKFADFSVALEASVLHGATARKTVIFIV
jgi:hypothetical protein